MVMFTKDELARQKIDSLSLELARMKQEIENLQEKYLRLRGYVYKKAGLVSKEDEETQNLNNPVANAFL